MSLLAARKPEAGRPPQAIVEEQLAEAVSRIRIHDLLVGVLLLASWTAAYAVIMIVVDKSWVLPDWLRQIGWCVFVAGTGGLIWWGLIRPWRSRINPLYAASQVEKTLEDPKNLLTGYVDVRERGQAPHAIQVALSVRAAQVARAADVNRAVDHRSLLYLGLFLGILIVVLATLFFSWRATQFSSLLRRAFLPFTPQPIATRTQITLLHPEGGDATITQGQSFSVQVHLSGRIPSEQSEERPRLLLRHSLQQQDYEEVPLQRGETNRIWNGKVPDYLTQVGFWYKIAAGDAETAEYRVTVRTLPLFTDFDVRYEYPAYMNRPADHASGPYLRTYRGTRITLRAKTNREPTSGRLLFEAAHLGSVEGQKLPGLADSLQFTFTVREGGRYRLRMNTSVGESNIDSPWYLITLDPDMPPNVRITQPPEAEVALPANGTLMVDGQVGDDFGIDKIRLRLRFQERDLQPIPYMEGRSFRRERDQTWPTYLTYKLSADLPRLRFADNTPFTPQEGMVLEYWVEAIDNCSEATPVKDWNDQVGNVGRSEVRRLRLSAPRTQPQEQQQQEQQRQARHQEEQRHNQEQQQRLETEDRTPPQQAQPQPKEGQPQANDGQVQPKDGPAQPKDGQPQPKDGQHQPKDGQSQAEDGQVQPKKEQPQPKDDQPQAKDGQPQVKDGQVQPKEAPSRPEDGQPQPMDGQPQAKSGHIQPKSGQPQAKDSPSQAKNSQVQPKDGPSQAKDGQPQLKDGPSQAKDGPIQPKDNQLQPKEGQADSANPQQAQGVQGSRSDTSGNAPQAGSPDQAPMPKTPEQRRLEEQARRVQQELERQKQEWERQRTEGGTAKPSSTTTADQSPGAVGQPKPQPPSEGTPASSAPQVSQTKPAGDNTDQPPAEARPLPQTQQTQGDPQKDPSKVPLGEDRLPPKSQAQGSGSAPKGDPQAQGRPTDSPQKGGDNQASTSGKPNTGLDKPKTEGTPSPGQLANKEPMPQDKLPSGGAGDANPSSPMSLQPKSAETSPRRSDAQATANQKGEPSTSPKQGLTPEQRRELEQAVEDLASGDPKKQQAARDKLDKALGSQTRQAIEKELQQRQAEWEQLQKDLNSADPARRAAAEKRLEELRRQAQQLQKSGQNGRKQDATAQSGPADPAQKKDAERKNGDTVANTKRPTEPAGTKQPDETTSSSKQTPALSPDELRALAEKARDLTSPDATKRQQAEQALDEKLGRPAREQLQKQLQQLQQSQPADEPLGPQQLAQELQKRWDELTRQPERSDTPSEQPGLSRGRIDLDKYLPRGGASADPLVEEMEADPRHQARSAALQLQEFERHRSNEELLRRLGWTPEDYERFLEAQRQYVEQLQRQAQAYEERQRNTTPPTGPMAAPTIRAGGAGKLESRPGAKSGIGGVGGAPIAPPGFEQAGERFFEELRKRQKR